MYETVLERFPRWVFGEFYWSAKYVRNFLRATHMFICWRARKRGKGMNRSAQRPIFQIRFISFPNNKLAPLKRFMVDN